MTGELFDGRKAAELGLVNDAVPKGRLRERVRELADVLLAKGPAVLKTIKDAFECSNLTGTWRRIISFPSMSSFGASQ